MKDLIKIPFLTKLWWKIRRIFVKLHILKPVPWFWYEIPFLTKLWWKIRRIFVKLHILKPVPWFWHELPGKVYVNPRAVKIIKKEQ